MVRSGRHTRKFSRAETFYSKSLSLLKRSKIPFMVAGTFAVNVYTSIGRATKDLDIFCKASDFPKILNYFQQQGYKTEIEDERWIAKVRKGKFFFDIIFNSTIAVIPVTESWFAESHTAIVCHNKVMVLPPTELIWSKVFVQDRYKYDGGDIAHVILCQWKNIDWKRLLGYMEQYWEVLLGHVINFRFIYPSEREKIPRWLFDELLDRLKAHADLPIPRMKICRGRLFSRAEYLTDVTEWGYADIIGRAGEKA